jgi:hypothetical protein
VLRALLVVVLVLTLRSPQRHARRRRWPSGAWIALGALALTVVPLLLLQLGSPVSPFMDTLPQAASPERIVTFRFYDPYRNDPSGLWAQTRQMAGHDSLFAFLALTVGVSAQLAMTSLIVPFAALQILALYLVGRAVGGHLAGGFATLFLLQTFTWRRTPDVRGTALAFILVSIGLVFLLGRRRTPARTALGGLAFGIGFPVNPLIAGAGMQLASLGVLVAWIDRGRPLMAGVMALAGAVLFAGPQVMISLGLQLPVWVLPVTAAAGLGLLALLTRSPPGDGREGPRAWRVARLPVIVGLVLAVLYQHAHRQSELFGDEWSGYQILTILALGGILFAAHTTWRRPSAVAALAIPALGLWVGLIDHAIASPFRFTGLTVELRSLASEVTPKMTLYWWPYWMTLAAGAWCGMLARRWARVPTIVLALVLVIYPLRHVATPVDFDGAQLSVAETWGFNLATAANGYHAGRPDRRWVLDDAWRELEAVLRREIASGRLDYDTHVLQITPSINSVETALATGVAVDLITPQYDPQNIWTGNGRARGMDALPAAFAAKPRYVLVEQYPPDRFPALVDYELMLETRQFRLYQRRGAGP